MIDFSVTFCKHRKHIMILMVLIPLLLGMGIDLYVPSLPAIAAYFKVSSSLVQQTIGFFMLSYGVGQFFLGVLSDIIGRKKIVLFGAFCFLIASILSIFSPNIYLLITYRFLQGLGLAGLGVAYRAVGADCFTGKELVKVMTYFVTAWALGPIVGPVIGGYLQHYFNWQANFVFFSIYGAGIFVYSFLVLPETNLNLSSAKPKEIYKNVINIILHPVFLSGACMLAFVYPILVLFNVIGPFLIQDVLKYSVVAYGQMALILGLGYFLGGLCNRVLIHKFKPMSLVRFAIIFGFTTSIVMFLLGTLIKINLYIIFIPILLQLFMCGLIFPNTVAKIISLFPKQAGTANAVYGTIICLGVFLMTVFAATLKTDSQLPMTATYIGLFLFCLLLFLLMQKIENTQKRNNKEI